MNFNSSEASERDDKPNEDQQPRLHQPDDQPDALPGHSSDASTAAEDAPIASEAAVRVGSPFAEDPLESEAPRRIEPFYDVGPVRYTAMGAVAASIMVLGFAGIAAWWFPAGGAMIAALGCLLSVFGMYSAFRVTALGLLALHLFLFVFSYGRSIS